MNKTYEKKLDTAEMRLLRWISGGVTKLNRMRSEKIRGTAKLSGENTHEIARNYA